MKIRKANRRDLPLVINILRRNNLPHKDIPSKLDCMFIAHSGGEVVGIGGVEILGRHGLLRSLVVEEEFRGKGYGRAICKELIELAKQKGVEELYLLTTNAEGFFRKLGFSVIKREDAPGVIQKTEEFSALCPSSAVCMRKKWAKKL